jgi:type II secretory pathway component PulC
MGRPLTSLLVAISLAGAALACGESPPARSAVAAASPTTAPPTTTTVAPLTTSLRRSQVKQAIGRGVGYFLQNVELDELPAMKGSRFYGWKLRGVSAELGVDLRPGDVVTGVNGLPLEHPEEADAALRALDKAPALRVDFEREGKPQTLILPITDD